MLRKINEERRKICRETGVERLLIQVLICAGTRGLVQERTIGASLFQFGGYSIFDQYAVFHTRYIGGLNFGKNNSCNKSKRRRRQDYHLHRAVRRSCGTRL